MSRSAMVFQVQVQPGWDKLFSPSKSKLSRSLDVHLAPTWQILGFNGGGGVWGVSWRRELCTQSHL